MQSESAQPQSDNDVVEQPAIPMGEDGIPLYLEDYVDLALAQHKLTREQLCYSVTALATGTVLELDHSQRLLGGFQCRAATPPEGEALFADATCTLRIASPDGAWYLEYHDGANADYLYFSEYDRYVQLYYRRVYLR